ncbi:D-alanyl-D-alanine endopeptidase [Undibacterium sp. TS12]|uniref:D-alanyl-D-alanine endopeptidase n=1 Tax=Undibacterium sp. TS12 TaxID=2908202 RepID=UPI001F4C6D44|nr:D-alanyl-D-alanine endopeptidase [Undibacterium sp. TS12]MCH8622678.1 D-alanyl-D-alanine endopeptidase [Undibacterium sp. TS12]
MVKFALRAVVFSVMALLPLSGALAASHAHKSKKHVAHGKAHASSSKKIVIHTASGTLVKRTVMVHGKRKVITERVALVREVPEKASVGDSVGLKNTQDPLELKSNVAYVVDQDSSKVLFEKNSDVSLPIASITKLMTSLIVVEAHQDMDELIEVTNDDIDKEKGTSSRLKIGAKLSRSDMLHIALMSSENRAASALGRNYPGGLPAFVAAMNAKAKLLGMSDTHYVDSSGLSSQNRASARDLVKLVNAAYQHPVIRQYSTDSKYVVAPGGKPLEYGTSNKLVINPAWEIGLQKTGYIAEAGRCLVMQAIIEGRNIVMVFLDSKGKYSRLADADRMKKWLETIKPHV